MALRNATQSQTPDRNSDPDEPQQVRIPLKIDDTMAVRSPAAPARIASCKVVGAVHGKCILITEPAIKINDRVFEVIDEILLCSCICDDYLYIFYSRYRNRVMGDIVCIEYPRELEIRRIREHTRICVDLETEVSLDTDKSVSAKMTDISRGGCRLTFKRRLQMSKGTGLRLTFELPNEVPVENLEAVIAKTRHIGNTTEIGLSFNNEMKEFTKVADFCEICRFV